MDKPHKKLDAWKVAIDLVSEVYRVTDSFPAREVYGLTSQIRRAAISVPSNIAEGAGRHTKKEFVNYLHSTGIPKRAGHTKRDRKNFGLSQCDDLGKNRCSNGAHRQNVKWPDSPPIVLIRLDIRTRLTPHA